MSTFTLPLRTRLPDGYSAQPAASGYNNENFLGTGYGYSPSVTPLVYTFADFASATAVTKTVVIPAGVLLADITADVKTAWSTTSAVSNLSVGVGAGVNTLMDAVALAQLGRKPYNVSAGVSLLGTPFTADTTVNIKVSSSGGAVPAAGDLIVNLWLA